MTLMFNSTYFYIVLEKEELLNEAKIIRDEHGPPPNPQEYLEDYRQISGCYKT